MTNHLVAAADYFNASFRTLLSTERGIHAETIIASAARMAGTMLFRSFAFPVNDFEPGTIVLSDEANTQGPKLVNLLLSTLTQLGSTFEDAANREAMDTKDSRFTLQKTQELLDPIILSYCSEKRINFEDAALSLAMTSAILVHDCRSFLDVRHGVGIALYGFVEGSKTAPIAINSPMHSAPSKPSQVKKPWFKWW